MNLCDLICKLKAASLPVIVPLDDARTSSAYDAFRLKMTLLNDLSHLPAETFISNRQTLSAAIKMIEFHLFYRIDEYTRFIRDIVARFPGSEAHGYHEFALVERAWLTILRPVYLILENIIRSSSDPKKDLSDSLLIIPSLVQLISSPIEEESKIAGSLVEYGLFNHPDSSIPNAIIANLNSVLLDGIKGAVPLLFIDPILKFIGDLMLKCYQKGRNHFVTTKLLGLVENLILPLHSHSQFFWIHDSYTHLAIQYFCFFEVSPGKSIKRSPFEPIFPEESPFEESENVILMRRNLLVELELGHVESVANHFARLHLLHQLYLYQFFPRAMIPEIFELLRSSFIRYKNIDSALHLYTLLIKPEIYNQKDEVYQMIKDGLASILNNLAHCDRLSEEMNTICSHLEKQINVINSI